MPERNIKKKIKMVKILQKMSRKEFFRINEKVAQASPMSTHYHSSNPFERCLWKLKKQHIKKLLRELVIKNIIDFGCGDGGLIELIPPKVHYTGVDISPTQIHSAKKRIKEISKNNSRILQGDITELKDIKDDSFDAALVCDVVEHVLSPDKLFTEIKRVIKKDGYIIFSIPNEFLLELTRALLFRFPLRSPDHIYAVFPTDIKKNFPSILKRVFLPIRFSSHLSLINIFLVKNIK